MKYPNVKVKANSFTSHPYAQPENVPFQIEHSNQILDTLSLVNITLELQTTDYSSSWAL